MKQDNKKTIKVLLCKQAEMAAVVEIGAELSDMQEIVGGYIEAISLGDGAVLICNDEGKLRYENKANRALTDEDGDIKYIIYGTFFICCAEGEEFTDITAEAEKRYMDMFRYPENFFIDRFGKTTATAYEPRKR